MKHGYTTTHLKQKDRQLSGQQLVKTVQSDQKIQQWAGKVMAPIIPGLFGNISKSGNIWGEHFYRTWTVKLTLPAHAQFMSFTVQVR